MLHEGEAQQIGPVGPQLPEVIFRSQEDIPAEISERIKGDILFVLNDYRHRYPAEASELFSQNPTIEMAVNPDFIQREKLRSENPGQK